MQNLLDWSSAAMTRPKKAQQPQDGPFVDGPAVLTGMHIQNRTYRNDQDEIVAGAKGWRRVDRLQWLRDHKSIGDHQLFAGRRLQEDWQTSKIEPAARMTGFTGGAPSSVLSDAALDAGQRVKDAMSVLPQELVTLTSLFLMPEDHPFSLERCAAIVREDRRAAAYGIRIALTLLARHYGYST